MAVTMHTILWRYVPTNDGRLYIGPVHLPGPVPVMRDDAIVGETDRSMWVGDELVVETFALVGDDEALSINATDVVFSAPPSNAPKGAPLVIRDLRVRSLSIIPRAEWAWAWPT